MRVVPFSVVFVACLASCSHAKDDAAAPPPAAAAATAAWQKTLVPSTSLGAPRGWTTARGVVHFHSPYSHDACDNWWHGPDGTTKTANDIDDVWRGCDAQLRDAVCAIGDDFVFITDHPAYMADFTIEQLLHFAPEDERLMEGGLVVGNRVACANGLRPLLLAGTEDRFMSLGLREHVPGTPDERRATYSSEDAIAPIRAAGGLAFVAHTEQRDVPYLQTKRPDGVEVYNLHANVDPTIRSTYLGLDGYAAVGGLLDFLKSGDDDPEPDLAFLTFLTPADVDLARWDALLATSDVVGVAGTDVHQNTIPGIFSDGERGDSYRRLLRWISNDVLTHDLGPDGIKGAVAAGRLFTVFEIFGSPIGFDFAALDASSAATEMGGHVKLSAAPKLVYKKPTLGGVTADPAPVIHGRLLRSTETGAVEVAASDGDLTYTPTEAGAYRVEVSIVPQHLRPYLGRVADTYASRTYPWIYANAIHVDP